MKKYCKPRLKSPVEFCSIGDKIYFFHRPGVAIQMIDPSKFIDAVCKLMDGKKGLPELVDCLSLNFPKETPQLEQLLVVLDNECLLEDVEQNYPTSLSTYETTRWSRNIEFFGTYCKATENKYLFQEKLKSIKVAVFGLGGVGSNILYNLVALGVYNIKAVDSDRVELSNLNRQIIYKESDIGQLKSESAKNQISHFSPNANIEFINKKVSSIEDIDEIICDLDIVICAIDHPREQLMDWFNVACVKHNCTLICGSLDSRLVTYFSMVPGQTGCIECWKTSVDQSSFLFQNLIKHENFVQSLSPNVAIMPFTSLVSGFVANEFLKIVTGISVPQSLGQLCTYDFISSQIKISESWQLNPACLVCSG